ncbi:MAG: hypothetical protein HY906_26925 [Deltaproteobacteria bacterium]|nr:hypothetical protein [Deltaproteobacteria bacterium]
MRNWVPWMGVLAMLGLAGCSDSQGDCKTGDADACLACLNVLMPGTGSGGECQQRLDECQADGVCESWRACRGNCWQNDPTSCCMEDCNTTFGSPGAAIEQCMCDNCATECGFLCQ